MEDPGFYFNEKFELKTFTKKSQWRHFIFQTVFFSVAIDESVKDPCICEETCLFFSCVPCLPVHQWLDSDQQYHFVPVHSFCNYHYEEAIFVYL